MSKAFRDPGVGYRGEEEENRGVYHIFSLSSLSLLRRPSWLSIDRGCAFFIGGGGGRIACFFCTFRVFAALAASEGYRGRREGRKEGEMGGGGVERGLSSAARIGRVC